MAYLMERQATSDQSLTTAEAGQISVKCVQRAYGQSDGRPEAEANQSLIRAERQIV